MARGMSQRQYENQTRRLAYDYFGAPLIILISMYAMGAVLDSFLHTTNTFSYIFLGIGGIPGIVLYYRSKWKEFVKGN